MAGAPEPAAGPSPAVSPPEAGSAAPDDGAPPRAPAEPGSLAGLTAGERVSPPEALDPALEARLGLIVGRGGPELEPRRAAIVARHRHRIERAWGRWEREIGGPMRAWARDHLPAEPVGRVFVPFSGPDIATPMALFPQADRYVLVAMQRAGQVPELDGLPNAALAEALEVYGELATSFAERGFFVTAEMNDRYHQRLKIRGLTGQLLLFVQLLGHRVEGVEAIRIADDGELVAASELPAAEPAGALDWPGVRIRLRDPAGRRRTVEYLRVNLADRALRQAPHVLRWLEGAVEDAVMVKAASHLPQTAQFRIIRELLVSRPRVLVQDETAAPYGALGERFDVRLYGNYRGGRSTVSANAQPALVAAFAARIEPAPLPFPYGYVKGGQRCLMVAVARAGPPLGPPGRGPGD